MLSLLDDDTCCIKPVIKGVIGPNSADSEEVAGLILLSLHFKIGFEHKSS